MKKYYDIGSKWTSLEKAKGYRHFRICGRRKNISGEVEIEMMAALDRKVRFWLGLKTFKSDKTWKQGWVDFKETLSPGLLTEEEV